LQVTVASDSNIPTKLSEAQSNLEQWDSITRFSEAQSNRERWNSIIMGFKMWSKSPFFGAGLGVFIEQSTEWFNRPIVIHSTPVWILAEFGLVGVAVFAWAFYSLLATLYTKGSALPPYTTLSMLLLTFSLFSLVHEIFYQRIFWMVLGAVLATVANSGALQNSNGK